MIADPENDEMLRRTFDDMRREDAAATPPYAALLEAPRAGAARWPPTRLLRGALAAAAVIASLAVGLLVRSPAPPPTTAPTLAWTAPTDFLLRTPGIEVLESVPHFVPPRSLLALDGAAGHQSNRRSPSP